MFFSSTIIHKKSSRFRIIKTFWTFFSSAIVLVPLTSLEANKRSSQIFVSASMPDSSIRQYYEEIKSDPESRLVMRGLIEGSMMKTKDYIERLRVIVDIDPPAFDEFGIKVVPTILVQEGEDQYYKHTGHVPVSYVLEKVQERQEK